MFDLHLLQTFASTAGGSATRSLVIKTTSQTVDFDITVTNIQLAGITNELV